MPPTHIDFEGTAQVDPHWLAEWAAFGISELETYLRCHARFDAYCNKRDLQGKLPAALRSAHAEAGR